MLASIEMSEDVDRSKRVGEMRPPTSELQPNLGIAMDESGSTTTLSVQDNHNLPTQAPLSMPSSKPIYQNLDHARSIICLRRRTSIRCEHRNSASRHQYRLTRQEPPPDSRLHRHHDRLSSINCMRQSNRHSSLHLSQKEHRDSSRYYGCRESATKSHSYILASNG